ncbi:MAG: 3-deoxy-7-phosphoheptulonate synthase [Calditrichaeota bacterium]|nr:3-deoxy-7-phosphoheptulonate synthase [Calditrichota bacterium]
MIIKIKAEHTIDQSQELIEFFALRGIGTQISQGSNSLQITAFGDTDKLIPELSDHPLIESIRPMQSDYILASRESHPHDSYVSIGDVRIGGEQIVVIAGPCSVESLEQVQITSEATQAAGAKCIRAGAFKPRSSPYSFQGMGEEGLKILKAVSNQLKMPVVSELMDIRHLEFIADYVDAVQIGARNMQNFDLLKAVGERRIPVLLKRGMSATLNEFLLAAEYILAAGNPYVILCERGIRSFETATRNTLDLSAVPFIKQRSHLPILVDPSHGTGVRSLIAPMSKAAIACGADGLLIEVHHQPEKSVSDAAQALSPDDFQQLMADIKPIVQAVGRTL